MTTERDLDRLDRPDPTALVVRRDASAEEVAAIVTVLQAMAAAAASREPVRRARPQWSSARQAMRPTHAPGPGAWRASALAP